MQHLQVWEHLPTDRELFLKAEQTFFDEVTQTSGKLFPFAKDERKAQAVKILKGIQVPRKVCTHSLSAGCLSGPADVVALAAGTLSAN